MLCSICFSLKCRNVCFILLVSSLHALRQSVSSTSFERSTSIGPAQPVLFATGKADGTFSDILNLRIFVTYLNVPQLFLKCLKTLKKVPTYTQCISVITIRYYNKNILIWYLGYFRGRHESWLSLKESKEIEDIESEADSIK